MTLLEAKQKLARKLDINYADIANNDLFSDADLLDYIQTGLLRAWDYKRWNFAEAAKTKTLTAPEIAAGYIDSPSDVMNGSARLVRIAGKEWNKKNYDDYVKFFEDNPGSTDKYWAQYKTFVFFNVNAASVGNVLDLYAKLKAPYISADADLLPFSQDTDNQEHSGNEAIVLFAFSEALSSEKKKNANQAMIEEKRAFLILDVLWKPFEENKAVEQSVNRPHFDVPDFFQKGGGSASTGTFTSV